ncbi:MAG: Zn-dependent hydrolase, partial [Thermotoga sp.]
NMGINIGIVTGIAAISRIKVTYIGEQGHAGTVPMNLRKDVTLALAETILKVREVVLATNANAVGTVGYIKIEPNVPNVIPGKVDFIIEIRSIHAKLKKELMANTLKQINNISKKYNVNSRVQIIVDEIPTLIDKQIVALIESSAKNLGYSTYRMISGAGHDASYMARITKIGMLFIPNRGGSHNPNEKTDLEDIIRGTKTLTNILKTLSE